MSVLGTSARVLSTALVLLASSMGIEACARQDGMQGTSSSSPTAGSLATGSPASDFTARDVEGRTVNLSQHLGKEVILLAFCATWCEPCIAEFPHLRKMQDANKAKGFSILAISMDGPETSANVPAFARRNQLNFPMLTDEDSRIASIYNPKKSAPLSVLISKAGKIVAIREGYSPGDEEFLANDVAKALDGARLPQ